MVPVAALPTAEAVVQSDDAAVKSAAMKRIPVKSTTTPETTAVEAAKSTSMKSTTVETPAGSVRCVGEIWLAEDGRAQ